MEHRHRSVKTFLATLNSENIDGDNPSIVHLLMSSLLDYNSQQQNQITALWYRLCQICRPPRTSIDQELSFSDLTLGRMPKMSQHIQHHHPQHPQYVHYTGPPGAQFTVTPQDTTRQPPPQFQQPIQSEQQQVQQTAGSSTTPVSSATTQTSAIVATGDWTKDLIHLAKTAELKYVLSDRALQPVCLVHVTAGQCSGFFNSMSRTGIWSFLFLVLFLVRSKD